MSTINPSVMAQCISPVYFMIILVIVGFSYHLIRNQEYKDTLIASVVMGIILGLIFNSSYDLLKTVFGDLIFILLIVLGGFIAVGVKKLLEGYINWNSNNQSYEFPENQLGSDRWWDRESPRVQATVITVACLISLMLIIPTVSILSTAQESVLLTLETPTSGEIELDDVKNKKDEDVILTFDNTSKFILKGYSEDNATVKITATELGIYNQTVHLDSSNNFTYKFIVPKNVSLSEIEIEASKLEN